MESVTLVEDVIGSIVDFINEDLRIAIDGGYQIDNKLPAMILSAAFRAVVQKF